MLKLVEVERRSRKRYAIELDSLLPLGANAWALPGRQDREHQQQWSSARFSACGQGGHATSA